jgi:hypothetical protein
VRDEVHDAHYDHNQDGQTPADVIFMSAELTGVKTKNELHDRPDRG